MAVLKNEDRVAEAVCSNSNERGAEWPALASPTPTAAPSRPPRRRLRRNPPRAAEVITIDDDSDETEDEKLCVKHEAPSIREEERRPVSTDHRVPREEVEEQKDGGGELGVSEQPTAPRTASATGYGEGSGGQGDEVDDSGSVLYVAPSTSDEDNDGGSEVITAGHSEDEEEQADKGIAGIRGIELVQTCCAYAVELLIRKPLCFNYEKYTAALEHLARHWPAGESVHPVTDGGSGSDRSESRTVRVYRRLRAALYTRFHRAFPLTHEMYQQWFADEPRFRRKTRIHRQSLSDHMCVPSHLAKFKFLHETGSGWNILGHYMEGSIGREGLHYTQGHEVWRFWRERLIHDFKLDKTKVDRERRVRDFFLRQLEFPTHRSEALVADLRAWNAKNKLEKSAHRRRCVAASSDSPPNAASSDVGHGGVAAGGTPQRAARKRRASDKQREQEPESPAAAGLDAGDEEVSSTSSNSQNHHKRAHSAMNYDNDLDTSSAITAAVGDGNLSEEKNRVMRFVSQMSEDEVGAFLKTVEAFKRFAA